MPLTWHGNIPPGSTSVRTAAHGVHCPRSLPNSPRPCPCCPHFPLSHSASPSPARDARSFTTASAHPFLHSSTLFFAHLFLSLFPGLHFRSNPSPPASPHRPPPPARWSGKPPQVVAAPGGCFCPPEAAPGFSSRGGAPPPGRCGSGARGAPGSDFKGVMPICRV